jgi:hypothetical protein
MMYHLQPSCEVAVIKSALDFSNLMVEMIHCEKCVTQIIWELLDGIPFSSSGCMWGHMKGLLDINLEVF